MTRKPTPDDDLRFMQMALAACRQGVEAGQTPFGACIVGPDGQVLGCDHNVVWLENDPTAHAEIHTIRAACRSLSEVHLTGATIYSTTEPCPMCFGAIHWARIGRIVYGASVEDARNFGFNELQISNARLKELSGSKVELVPHLLREQALELYQLWQQRGGKSY